MNLNILGLILDIIGVTLLWKFGLPESIDRSGAFILTAKGCDENEKKKAKIYDCVSIFALLLLIVGFGLQIVYSLQTQDASKQNQENLLRLNQLENSYKELIEKVPKQ